MEPAAFRRAEQSVKVDGDMKPEEKAAYLNHGNDLSVSCYVYSNVEKYIAKKTNPNYVSLGGVLYSKDKKHLIAVPNHYKGILDIPEGTEKWDKQAIWTELDFFEGLAFSDVTEICIPSSMQEIDLEQIDIVNRLKDLNRLIDLCK